MVTAQTAFTLLQKIPLGKGEKWDLFCLKSRVFAAELDGDAKRLKSGCDVGLGIRFIKNHRVGFAFTTGFEKERVRAAFQKAREMTQSASADRLADILPPDKKKLNQRIKKFAGFFPPLKNNNQSDVLDLLGRISRSAALCDRRIFKVPRVIFEKKQFEISLGNFGGFWGQYSQNLFSLVVQAVAKEGNQMQSAFSVFFGKDLSTLNPEDLGKEAAAKALRKLGAEPVATGRYQIVFEPETGGMMLSLLSGALSAEEVIKNRSFLKEKIGRPVASKNFTLIDDGFLKEGLISAPFDGEGTPTSRTVLINGGILKNYFHSTRSARHFKMPATGNGLRPGYSSLPQATPTNLYLTPGRLTAEQLIGQVEQGLLVTELYGLHTADRVSGSFSLGVEGQLIEKGRIKRPVKGVVLSGKLDEFLKKVVAVALDLKFFLFDVCVWAPHFLVADLNVSGC